MTINNKNRRMICFQQIADVLSVFNAIYAMISEQNIGMIETDSNYNDKKTQEQKDNMLPAMNSQANLTTQHIAGVFELVLIRMILYQNKI